MLTPISNTAQALPTANIANDRLTSEGAPAGVITNNGIPTNSQAAPTVTIELPVGTDKPVDQPKLQNIVDGINRALKQADKNLEFSIDEDTKKAVIKLVDSETGDVIREFPSKEALAISHAIEQMQQGLLLKQKA